MRSSLLVLAAIAGCAETFPPPSPAGCVRDVTAGVHAVECSGLEYQLAVAASCLSRACGLIIDVHGATMNAAMQDHNTNLRALGNANDFLVLQPSADNGSWDPDRDDKKVRAFIDQVIAAFHVDRARIHFTGFSQGGFMTWRFICAHADLLASAAPAAAGETFDAAGLPSCDFDAAATTLEIPILFMHGTDDALVSFESAVKQRDRVIAAYGLDQQTTIEESAAHRWTRHTNASGALLEFLEHDYITDAAYGAGPLRVELRGHCFPGSTDLEATVPGQLMPFACKTPSPSAFVWGEAALAFFLAHPKP